jgi:YopJ family protease
MQTLRKIQKHVQQYIDKDIPPDSAFGRMDFEAMPHLVAWANTNYAGLALHHAGTPSELAEKLKELSHRGVSSARFVGNLEAGRMHFCAFDYKLIDGKHSLIGLEPGNSNNMGPALMTMRMEMALQEHLPNAKFAMLEVNQQSSAFDCGMFSLDYAVKMHKSSIAFENLHAQNASDSLPGKNDSNIVPHSQVDKILPPIFMKHIQSSKRLAEIVDARRELKTEIINKRGDTLEQRTQRNNRAASTSTANPRNESIAYQRSKYLQKAISSLD